MPAPAKPPNHIRYWLEVAEQMAAEKDPKKLGELAVELNRLLCEEEIEREKHLARKAS
jgi:hypothetical protein